MLHFGRRRSMRVLLAVLLVSSVSVGLPSAMPHSVPEVSAAYPGANGKIAFSSRRTGNDEIFVMDADGSNPINITNHPNVDCCPKWSPDGTRIAFVSNRTGRYRVHVMDADGSNVRQISLASNISDGYPTWSPDGTQIAFDRETLPASESSIVIADALGTSETVLVESATQSLRSPSWSPDGTKFAYFSAGNIWVMNVDGSNPVNLTAGTGQHPGPPDWSPDGTRILFKRNSDFWVMDADGRNAVQLTSSTVGGSAAWSPDGTKIVYEARPDSDDLNNVEIFIMNADGSNPVRITNHPALDAGPNWQPVTGCALLLVPGIAGTYAADVSNDMDWLLNRGVHPDHLRIDPLARAYDDLITTLENVGYVRDQDLFVVNYDWRLPPAPFDGTIDGQISGLSGASITDSIFEHSVDYLGYYLRQAVEAHETHSPDSRLSCVDVIAHSTGGLVTRGYIQSTAYRDTFLSTNGQRELPRVNEFIMLGVPNRGASKAWNPLQDNWTISPAYRLVLSKIINRAFQKVFYYYETVSGPDYDITESSILDPFGHPDHELMIRRYVPTINALLATYDFIDFGNGFTNVNSDPQWRNNVVLDLNNGLDLFPTADPSPFASLTSTTVIYGANQMTPTSVIQRTGPAGRRVIQPFRDFIPRDAQGGEIWYQDRVPPLSGDGTVPIESAAGQFVGDNRVTLIELTAANTSGATDHLGLVGNRDVQATMLTILGRPYQPGDIATGTWRGLAALSIILDPVEGFVMDGEGRRLGYSTATGPLAEIPNSIWFGHTDGFGVVYEALTLPLSLALSGLGEDHYVQVSVAVEGHSGGVTSAGFLDDGEELLVPVSLSDDTLEPEQDTEPPTLQVPARIEVDATSPAGAAVPYVVTASDTVTAEPVVECTPPPGSLFPIGATTVECVARDEAGNAARASFEVHVRGAAVQLAALRARVQDTPMAPSTRRVLTVLLDGISLENSSRPAHVACVQLTTFNHLAGTLPDRSFAVADRQALRADAARIRAVLGCR
jgi:Tol biopolymer transport system component